ncbi:MAG TPA: zinc-dependent metalloprotease family protein, partial [Pyrinomonadaceae bacterium]|nr:zinc-dependent metalloprotease family protein [Pyrinomonadaceae bacterium]
IDPYSEGDVENYITYFKRDVPRSSEFECEFDERNPIEQIFSFEKNSTPELIPDAASPEVTSGTQLRTYRLALAATNEYSDAVGSSTVAGTLAAEVLIMNRVNGVYERDVAIHMNIVANTNLITFADDNLICGPMNNEACTPNNDPYTNNNGSTMLNENQNKLDAVIGTTNYDIGHVFSTGGGGIAQLNAPCGSGKARGVTGLSNPVGDPFAIDYVAHEMGHQWGGSHTMNGCSRTASAAYETGSGITIMAYAGICGAQDLARHSIDTFHVKSLEQIVAYSQTANGNSCAATTASGNTPPAVSVVGGPLFNIPKQTPFALTAAAFDVNGDSITYDWQEYDLGPTASGQVPNTDSDGQARPIFRPYLPGESPTRFFPSMEYILANANVPPATYDCGRATPCLTGELLPAITRTMTFQVVARDNRQSAGGINTATATVNVDGNSGPFAITFPNTPTTIIVSDHSHQVTWNVANTTAAPVNAATVRILLSTDGGQTYPHVLAPNTPNDGSEHIFFPGITTTTARLKIEAVNNIFFDVSDTNFGLQFVPFPSNPEFDFDGDGKTDISIYRPSGGEWWYQRSVDGQVPAVQFGTNSDVIVPADFTGDAKTDIAFWRPSDGSWYVLRSENNTYFALPFGTGGDIPVPADFDGDLKSDAAVFRPSNSTWYINRSGGGTTITPFGAAGDRPVPADYDGDGKADIGIFRPNGANGAEWWIDRSTSGLLVTTFGASTDKVVQGDYTGDAKADIAFWRPATGEWFVLRSDNFSFYSTPFGADGDTPVPGDYDGDGRLDTAVFRPATTTWYVNRSSAGTLIQNFGLSTDKPVPSAFVQ